MSSANTSTSDKSQYPPLLSGPTTKTNDFIDTNEWKRKLGLEPSNKISHYYVDHGNRNKLQQVWIPIPLQDGNNALIPSTMNETPSTFQFQLSQHLSQRPTSSLPQQSDHLNKAFIETVTVGQLDRPRSPMNLYPGTHVKTRTCLNGSDNDDHSKASIAGSFKENMSLPSVVPTYPRIPMIAPMIPLQGISHFPSSAPVVYPSYPLYPNIRQTILQQPLYQAIIPPMHVQNNIRSSPKTGHQTYGRMESLLNPTARQWVQVPLPPLPVKPVQYDVMTPRMQQEMHLQEQEQEQQQQLKQDSTNIHGVRLPVLSSIQQETSDKNRKYKLWTEEEDQLLIDCKNNLMLSWKAIALRLPTRTMHACQFRWRKIKMASEYEDLMCESDLKSENRFDAEKSVENKKDFDINEKRVESEEQNVESNIPDKKKRVLDGTDQNKAKDDSTIVPKAKKPKRMISKS